MKKIKFYATILACIALVLGATSCKDGKNPPPVNNEYTFDGTTYPILSAGIWNDGEGDYCIGFSRTEVTDNFVEPPSSFIFFTINEADFGASTSEYWNFVFFDDSLGIDFGGAESGAVKVVKDGDTYTIDFEWMFDDEGAERRLKGHYAGELEEILW